MEGITDSLRTELHPFGIRVALVEPGAVAAAIWEKSSRDADTLSQSAPPELQAFYARLMSKIREETAKAARTAAPAETVARAVEHALTARRPKTRYVIGSDARVWLLLNLLPDAWRDRLILSGLK